MIKFSTLAVALLAGALIGGSATAADPLGRQEQIAQKLHQRFNGADKNGDGQLTKEEANEMPFVYRHFDAIDSQGSGVVTMDQVREYIAQRMASQGGKP